MGTAEITRRLKRVEGQIRGLERMVEEDRDCETIMTQVFAARAALDRVGLLVVDRFVERCLDSADPVLVQQRVGRVLRLVFSRYSLAGAAAEAPEPQDFTPFEEE